MLARVTAEWMDIAGLAGALPPADIADVSDAAKRYDPTPVVYASLALLAAIILLGAGLIVWHRRRNQAGGPTEGFSLVGIRELHERGEITPEEYLLLRQKIVARFKKAADFKEMPPESVEAARRVARATPPENGSGAIKVGTPAEEPPEPVLDGDVLGEPGAGENLPGSDAPGAPAGESAGSPPAAPPPAPASASPAPSSEPVPGAAAPPTTGGSDVAASSSPPPSAG